MNDVMETHALRNCRLEGTCRSQPHHRTPLAARLLALGLSLAGGLLAASGEQWLLEEAPPAANELTLASCVLDDVYGDVRPATDCTLTSSAQDAPARGHAL